ncbi:hypothetical protein EPH95_02645 [Salicibibacter halophilus]|uniref:Uncharacterized protein n=1 Tax=Salicibibacter halophilus TaxID=2502791 RepID=A0A514LEC8_9BACI|nr:hypothetical protein [Salicibibacter halophilus]QDI90204.1 hypothetical protein EPH95_02645 [Salicibibacter halophilus]
MAEGDNDKKAVQTMVFEVREWLVRVDTRLDEAIKRHDEYKKVANDAHDIATGADRKADEALKEIKGKQRRLKIYTPLIAAGIPILFGLVPMIITYYVD